MKVIPRMQVLIPQVRELDETERALPTRRGEVHYYERQDRVLTDLVDDYEWIDADGEYLESAEDEVHVSEQSDAVQSIATSPSNQQTVAGYTELPTADRALASVISGGQAASGRAPTHALTTPQSTVDERLLQILRSSKLFA